MSEANKTAVVADTHAVPGADEPRASATRADDDAALARIESVADLAPPSPRAAYASGRSVELGRDAPGVDTLTVRSPTGQVELSVRFTPDGPVLRFAAAELELESRGAVRVACDTLEIAARKDISLHAGADLVQRVDGDQRVDVAGAASLEAHKVDVRSRRGDVSVKANDDVRIDGERVLLNS